MAKGRVGLGRRGESLVATELQKRGFTIITRNWNCAQGEVDLVALRNDEWYFVEVRTRRSNTYGSPEASLIPRKVARMERVARQYLGEHHVKEDVAWHLSFAAVALSRAGQLQRITLYPDLHGEPIDVLL